jgi:hypothetical protein
MAPPYSLTVFPGAGGFDERLVYFLLAIAALSEVNLAGGPIRMSRYHTTGAGIPTFRLLSAHSAAAD